MKILLVFPKMGINSVISDFLFGGEPLALEYLAAGLHNHHDIQLLDMRQNPHFTQTVESFLPDIVGFTAYTVHVNAVNKLSQQVKTLDPRIIVVVGGHHATISPKDFYIPSIDIVVKGEGVITFNEIVKRIEKKDTYTDMKGTSVNVNGTFVENTFNAITDFDAIPFPNRFLRNKQESSWNTGDMSFVVTSQGCAFKCKFCSCWEVTNGKYMVRDLSRIVEELHLIRESSIHFADDESFLIPQRMTQLATLIHREGIKKNYYASIRSDTVCKNPEMLQIWKDIGLSGLFIGLETFKEDDLQYYNKKSLLDQNIKALTILKEIGIPVFAGFVIRQDYDEQDFDRLADFVKTIPVDIVSYTILTPLPHTQLYREQEKNFITHNYDLFDLCHTVLPTKLPLQKFYREIYHLSIRTFKLSMNGFKKLLPNFTDGFVPPKWLGEGLKNFKHAYQDHEQVRTSVIPLHAKEKN